MFCELFGYSKQAYYKQAQFKARSQLQIERAKSLVLHLRKQMPRLGTRKLYYLLRDDFSKCQIKMGRDKLFDFLRSEGLLILRRKKYTITTNSKHWMRKYPNLIKDLNIHRPEHVWSADITFIDTVENGNCYLHLITDTYSKQIMGYELCNNMEASSTVKALKMAIKNRQYKDQHLIHHSDRGLQYCSKTYTQTLNKNKITISMTENGDPYENAVAERVNGILKDEFGLSERLSTLAEANKLTTQSIKIYNSLRPHLSCQMLTPNKMHQQQKITIKRYKKKSNIFEDV
jgi:transposase InsO family protein